MKVEYVCHSGSDLLVVDAARASFGKQSKWEEVEEGDVAEWYLRLSAKDTKLINFLAREKHLLPFRHPSITFRCRAPLFVARQLGKHQTGMSWSEESRRYITTEPEFYWPDKWRKKADNVKQGSSDETMETMKTSEGYETTPSFMASAAVAHSVFAYEQLLQAGVAPELARMILPQNMMITWVWTGTLLSWVHMIRERTAPTTQRETQEFARMVETILRELYPVSMSALLGET